MFGSRNPKESKVEIIERKGYPRELVATLDFERVQSALIVGLQELTVLFTGAA
jgi:hypothetical protein